MTAGGRFTMITVVRAWIQAHTKDERGATMVEYAIMVALIAVVVLLVVMNLGTSVQGTFKKTDTCIANPNPANCP
ncbi:MAG: Flp family type IVb pilin [Actinomycetota bacterium]